jgi:hypothetical protein
MSSGASELKSKLEKGPGGELMAYDPIVGGLAGRGTSDKCEHLQSTSSLGRADQGEERDYEPYRRDVGENVAGAEGHRPATLASSALVGHPTAP